MRRRVLDALRSLRGNDRRSRLLQLAAVFGAYYLVAELGLRLSLVERTITPLWPPTGVALVACLSYGRRVWPAVAIAAFAVNAPLGDSLATAAGIAVGNTLAPVVAATLLVRVDFSPRLQRVRDALTLVFLGALVSMAISATIGTLTLLASDAIPAHRFAGSWLVWWTGDAMGVVIVAPFLWSLAIDGPRLRRAERLEAIVAALVLVGVWAIAFLSTVHPMFLLPPFVGWIAWRFQQRGAAPAALVVSVLATWAAVEEVGPFEHASLVDRMVVLQSFNAIVALTSIVTAAAISQRQRVAEREHRVIETLQRSLLPERLPDVPGVDVAARYMPASHDVALGGDWYDVIPLPDGRVGLGVGDVAGHGVGAAASMGQLRMALRAYALEELEPSDVIGRLNRVLRELHPNAMATLWYGNYDPATRELRFASAGHPPPMLVDARRTARYIEAPNGPPLGVVHQLACSDASLHLDVGTTILLYTDGLVERRRASIDEGLNALSERVRQAPAELEALCDHVMDGLTTAPTDDVALLAIRPTALVGTQLRLRRPAVLAGVPEARHMMRRWLEHNHVASDDAFDALVAATEAYTNVVQHAYGLQVGAVEVDALIGDGRLEIAIRDRGRWRGGESLRDDGGGRGLLMMRTLMDTVEIDSDQQGTEVRMRRALKT
ncbi:MAG TPA: SpoIIE family protein phosphatase [Acidimicrobiia bacterium]|nr:SpoIIE family protein phosphatase [Acidimicrobiia bacterium]